MRRAFDEYRARGWVVHSLEITAYWDEKKGKEKKKPHGWFWKGNPSCYKPNRNSMSINTGDSKLIVIDVDEEGMSEWASIERLAGGPFDTFTVESANGGVHVYFNAFDHPDLNKTCSKCFLAADGSELAIDLRGLGGVIFAPPSSYKSLNGEVKMYKVARDLPVIDMPETLRTILEGRLKREIATSGARVKPAKGDAKRKRGEIVAPVGTKMMDESLRLQLARFISGMSPQRARPVEAWQNIIYSCANIACMYKFDESVTADTSIQSFMLGLAHTFSEKGEECYHREGVNDFFHAQVIRWKANPGRGHNGIPVLENAYYSDGGPERTIVGDAPILVVKTIEPSLFAPERDLLRLMKLFEFPTRPYVIAQYGTTRAKLEGYIQVEHLKIRASDTHICHICNGTHKDNIRLNVYLNGCSYKLKVAYYGNADASVKCAKTFMIGNEARDEYTAAFLEKPELALEDVAGVAAACAAAGFHLRSSPLRVWRLDDPAPGWFAHAVFFPTNDAWLLLLQPATGGGMWRRRTLFPGLFYEFLDESAWEVSDPPATEKPPFWLKV